MLKARTAHPPRITAHEQQCRFGDFVRWMNMDRSD
jgi:hypothetical protein